jgi:hypothetical protein
MSYIVKNSTQGAIVARLTDAGRKKLSEGKLNIGLFQVGDSEFCYDCYTNSLAFDTGTHILQAEHNAQNLLGFPAKNKGHVKYPLQDGIASGDTFGPTIPQPGFEEVYNTAAQRGFFSGTGCNFGAEVGFEYVLNSNWVTPASAMTGGATMQILSAGTTSLFADECYTDIDYTPMPGDLISVTYQLSGGTSCFELNCDAPSPTLFYQVLDNGGVASDQQTTTITLTLDRDIADFNNSANLAFQSYSAETFARVRVYPGMSADPMTTDSIYVTANTSTYWCNDTLSFNSCCDVSEFDAQIWNMNINWTHTVAGVDPTIYEGVNHYGSSGYSGSKEYFGLESDNGQTFSNTAYDDYQDYFAGTWYYDSFSNVRGVKPSEQKCAGFIHYTNLNTTDFYGEKFALESVGYNPATTIGEARNFKMHLPWLMWHKKTSTTGSGAGTGMGDETKYGQTFYVDPAGFSVFPVGAQPHLMQSNLNPNMNDDGLRYYHLWDDNSGSGTTNPNRVGKVFPDYKMVVIDDEELLAAMSYKSNRSWTLPAPKTEKFPAGTMCTTGCTGGAVQFPGDTLYMTYMLVNTGMTTGLHCNYYVKETKVPGETDFDVAFTLGREFPYLITDELGTGFTATKVYILTQLVQNGNTLNPADWHYRDVTAELTNHTVGDKISASQLVGHTFYITEDYTAGSSATCPYWSAMTSYNLDNFINIPSVTQPTHLQFGDEYFFYGSLATDIMATIYEMKHVVQLGNNQYTQSTNPTWVDYNLANVTLPAANARITEIGLFDNENGNPDLMAIAKLQSPITRTGTQQFTITIDF